MEHWRTEHHHRCCKLCPPPYPGQFHRVRTANLSYGCSGILCPSWFSHPPQLFSQYDEPCKCCPIPRHCVSSLEGDWEGWTPAVDFLVILLPLFLLQQTPEPGSFTQNGDLPTIDLKVGSPRSETGFIAVLFYPSGQEEESEWSSLNSPSVHEPTFLSISPLMKTEPSWTTHLLKVTLKGCHSGT